MRSNNFPTSSAPSPASSPAGLLSRASAFAGGHAPTGWRSAAALLALALAPASMLASALAGPEGEQVTRGNVQFERNGNQTLIRASDRSIINYRSFDIGANESVRFIQPGAESRVLNRINSAAPTRIDGSLSANGRVYIVNPAGVVFGQGSVVNTAGLFAAAGQLSDADFLRGTDRFTGLSGSVTNAGLIQSQQVVMAGRQVANYGSIVAPQGTVAMAAGQDVVITQRDGAMHVRVSGNALGDATTAAVTNTGTIDTSSVGGAGGAGAGAQGGQVIMAAGDVFGLAINTTGSIKGRSVQLQGQGTGDVVVGGMIDASNSVRTQGRADGRGSVRVARERDGRGSQRALTPREQREQAATKGGSIDVVGQRIALFNTTLDVSGQDGGGIVRIGGDERGQRMASDLANAQVTVANQGTTIRADATGTGDGGRVILWADDTTRSFAAISANAGERGGDGGFIETSGKSHLSVDGSRIEANATRGSAGEWLLDPRNVVINDAGPTTGSFSALSPDIFTPSQDDSVVLNSDITSRLDAGTSVTITTGTDGTQDGNITVANDVLTTGTGATLRFDAANSIFVNSGVSVGATGGGQVNILLNANRADGSDPDNASGAIVLDTGSSLVSQGGNITLGGGPEALLSLGTAGTSTYNGALRASAARGTTANPDGVSIAGATINAGSGTVSIRGAGRNDSPSAAGVSISGASLVVGGIVRIDGIGANATGTGADAVNGVEVTGGAIVRSIGGGVTLNGTAGTTSDGADAVGVRLANGTIEGSSNGFAIVNGFGGSGTGARNHGILLEGGSQVRALGINGVGMTGRASGSGDLSHGIVITDGTVFSNGGGTSDPAVRVVGTGGTGNGSVGLLLDGGSASINTATKRVELEGSSTGTLAAHGVAFVGGSSVTGAGVSVTGASTNASGIAFVGGPSTINSATNALTLRADTMNINSAVLDGTGSLSVENRSANTTIGLGDGAAGTLSLSDDELSTIFGGTFTGVSIGASNAGLMTANALDLTPFGVTGIRLTGTSLTTAGITTNGAQNLTLRFNDPTGGTGTVTQTGAINAPRLALFGSSQFVLRNESNDFGTLAGNLSGTTPNSIFDSNGFDVGIVGSTSGLTNSNGTTTLRAQSGTISTSAGLFVDSGELALTSDEIDLGSNVSGPGRFTLRPVTDSQNIRLGGTGDTGAGVLDITSDELAFIQDGLNFLTIGSTTGTGTLSFTAPVTFRDSTLLRMGNAGGSGTLLVNQPVSTSGNSSLTLRASTITLSSDVQTQSGAILFNGLTSVDNDVTVRSNASGATTGANITFSGGLDADDAANDRVLTIDSGTAGDTTFNGVVGSAQRFASVNVAGRAANINGGVRTKQGQTYDTIVNLAGELSANAGDILFQRLVTIVADSTITSSGLAGDDVTFAQSITSSVAGADLSVTTGTGAIFLQGSSTLGRQAYSGNVITLSQNLTGSELVFTGPVVLAENVLLEGTSLVSFSGSVNSVASQARNLTINSPATTFLGDVGLATDGQLGTLITNPGTLSLASNIRTNGDIDIADNITITGNSTLTSLAGGINLRGSVNSDATPRDLTLSSVTGNSLRGGAGNTSALRSITASASGTNAATTLGGTVETTTASSFGGAVRLSSDTTVRAPGVTFGGTIDAETGLTNAPSLTIVSTGQPVTFSGAVGGDTATPGLRAMDVTGSLISLASVRTTGNQRYAGPVRVAGTLQGGDLANINFTSDVLLTGATTVRTTSISPEADITFAGSVNSAGLAPFDLTVDAGSGDVSFAQDIGTTAVAGNTTLGNVEASGNSVTLRSVRSSGRQIFTGATFLNGNLTSTTSGDIAIAGGTTLLADTTIQTTSGGVTFSGPVDSDGNTARALTVNTGGNGVTRFQGQVGNTNRLASISTNADGRTVIATNLLRTSGDQVFGDGVTLGTNSTIEANDIAFQGTLDSDTANTPRNLLINSVANGADTGDTTFGGRVGGTRRLGSLTTNAEGETRVASDISTSRAINFGDPVRLSGSAIFDAGNSPITFRNTLNADSGSTDPILTLRSNASGDVDGPAFRFGGSVGVAQRLGGLILGADRPNALASTIVFTDALDQQGRITAAGVQATDAFTVQTAAGGFQVGSGHKLVSFGSLNLTSTGTVTLSDTTVLGDLRVTGARIELRQRGSGDVQTNNRQRRRDPGPDIVSAGLIDFSRAPVAIGSGLRPAFSPGNGQADPEIASAEFTYRFPTRPINATDFVDGSNSSLLLPLDLIASGASRTNITTAIRQPAPGLAQPTGGPAPLLGPAAIEGLELLGVSVRGRTMAEVIEGLQGRNFDDRLPTTGLAQSGVRNDIISQQSVEGAVASYRGLLYGPMVDERGNPVVDELGQQRVGDRSTFIRDVLGASWARYSERAKKPTGEGWRAFLETQGSTGPWEESQALAFLNQTRETLRAIANIGLPVEELAIPRRKVIDAIKPVNITEEREFVRAVEGVWQLTSR